MNKWPIFKRTQHLLCMLVFGFFALASKAENRSFKTGLPGELHFIENKGQIKDQYSNARQDIQFVMTGNGMNLFIGNGQLHYQFSRHFGGHNMQELKGATVMDAGFVEYARIDVALLGADANAKAICEEMDDYYENFYTTGTGEKGVRAHAYTKIVYKDIYPSIDWVLYVNNGVLKHEFVVREGGDASKIKLQYRGAELKLNEDGSLSATTKLGVVEEQAPLSYQADGKKIFSAFALDNGVLSYKTATYTGALVIDPTLAWATNYGPASTRGLFVTTDASGNVYLVGDCSDANNIATVGSYQATYGGVNDGFYVKFNSAGARLYATYYGGSDIDEARSIALDAAGNIYMLGNTQSTNNIATAGAEQATKNGDYDSYLVKFDNTGARIWATYSGGNLQDLGYSLKIDNAGNLFVMGRTQSTNFSTAGAWQATNGGGYDGYLACYNNAGQRQWCTYYGGAADDMPMYSGKLGMDNGGNLYVAGYTKSTNNIASAGAFQTTIAGGGGKYNLFLAKFNSAGQRQWSTYYGSGGSDDITNGVCDADTAGNVYLGGSHCCSSGISALSTPGAYKTSTASSDAVLAKFNTSGAREWGTYFGGSNGEDFYSLSADPFGNVYIVGNTSSTSGIYSGGIQASLSGTQDQYIAKFSGAGSRVWGTYYGGNGLEQGYNIWADIQGSVLTAGTTYSSSGFATAGAYQTALSSPCDAALLKIGDCPVPTQPGAISGNATVCASATETYSVTAVAGASSYTWTLPSGWTGTSTTNSITVTTGTSGGTISVTANVACGSSTPRTLVVTVNSVLPTVSISANPGTTICPNTNVTFTATITNGGATPAYQWNKNGNPVGANQNSYSDNALTNNDVITCTLTSNATCASPASVTSTAITMTVTPTVTPTVSISANPGSTICPGTNVTFTAAITNGGTTPAYQWKKNGNPVGTNQSSYSDNTLANSDVITCTLTSNATCASPTSVTSAGITMTVTANVVPTVSISANPGNTICAGTNVSFTANITNGGTTPVYQWKKNGNPVGGNQNTYSDNGLANNDIITCTMTSNAPCATPVTVTSTGITMTVNPVLVPTVSISANPGNTICAGTNVTFTASITNGGATPQYQWKKNGNPVGSNQNTYSDNALVNTDVITCMLTSNETCATPTSVTSTGITMTVNPVLTPAVSISANTGTTICTGATVIFTAVPTNGGANPQYQWYKNGTPVGTNQNSYTDNGLNNNDVISCVMTSNGACVSPATATSNSVTMTVNAVIVPTVSLSATPGTTICAGTSVTFTATTTGGGAGPSYQWYLNGAPAGANQDTYTVPGLVTGDVIKVQLTSNATCATPASVMSSDVTMTVNPLVFPQVNVNVNPGNTICAGMNVTFTASPIDGGTNPQYQWEKNGNPVGANQTSYSDNLLNNGDIVHVIMTSNAACATPATTTSNDQTITWNTGNTLAGTAGNTETNAVLLAGPADVLYTDCDLMASIIPNGVSPVSGSTNIKVTLDNVVNSFNGNPYVQRHFDIEPQNNAASATADIKLYAYQSEFDAYNTTALAAGYPLLPTGGIDNGNIRITQFHGTGTLPGNYTGTELQIVPSVSWNATNGWWEMSFPVTGFSGFYIHTALNDGPLAVQEPTDITATNVGKRNRVDWYTREDHKDDMFTIERSTDGSHFAAIGKQHGRAQTSVYTYWDEQPVTGKNYYRVQLTTIANQSSYTKVVSATVKDGGFTMETYPNPVHNTVTVQVTGKANGAAYITLLDMAGKVIGRQALDNNKVQVDMSGVAQGVYMLRYTDGERTETMRISKTE